MLIPKEEKTLVEGIRLRGDWGFPLSKHDIRLHNSEKVPRQEKCNRKEI